MAVFAAVILFVPFIIRIEAGGWSPACFINLVRGTGMIGCSICFLQFSGFISHPATMGADIFIGPHMCDRTIRKHRCQLLDNRQRGSPCRLKGKCMIRIRHYCIHGIPFGAPVCDRPAISIRMAVLLLILIRFFSQVPVDLMLFFQSAKIRFNRLLCMPFFFIAAAKIIRNDAFLQIYCCIKR